MIKKAKPFLFFTLILPALLTACSINDHAAGTSAPTADALNTNNIEASAVPTDAAFETGGKDYASYLEPNSERFFDIDGDGLSDLIAVSISNSENDNRYTLTVTRGADPYSPYTLNVYYNHSIDHPHAWVIDSDPNDGRLEIIESDNGPSDDPSSTVIRVKSDGSGFEQFSTGGVKAIDFTDKNAPRFPFSSENGFEVCIETFVLGGGQPVIGTVRIGENGLEVKDNRYYYSFDEGYQLKLPMQVFRMNADGSKGEAHTLAKGTVITPDWLDARSIDDGNSTISFAAIKADGEYFIVEVEAISDRGILINGINQWSYADFGNEG